MNWVIDWGIKSSLDPIIDSDITTLVFLTININLVIFYGTTFS